MTDSHQPHVLVIGAGIVGASIAWHLAKSTKVTIIAQDIGGPASSASFAWLNASSASDKSYHNFRVRSLKRWKEIERELPDLPITWGGSVNWHKPMETLLDKHVTLTGWGYTVMRMTGDEINSKEPGIKRESLPEWGFYYTDEGAIEAHVAAQQMVADAEDKGNVKVIKATAKAFTKSNGRVTGVILDSGEEVHGDHVVVAAGLGTVPLLATEDITIPIRSVPALIVNSKPAKHQVLNSLINSKYLYIRQTKDGVVRAGCENPGDDPGEDPEKTAHEVFKILQDTLAGGDKLEFDYFTVGNKPTPKDGLPIIGQTGLDNVSVAVMHSGVTNAAIVGELVSKQILTGDMDTALEQFRLNRFTGRL
ncbi:opine oxidase subunit b [Fusarium flagelliforme]|uniref:Opine oxidase subunit b n=1 Tax=Fusarium flagelliforme TaxID=2675880 RepID=A0A395MCS6_9HYPO|nr:opine oxidase subunit b [Fusarium flagelliforme]